MGRRPPVCLPKGRTEQSRIVVVGLNERDAAWHDASTIDLASGRRDLVFENRDGYRGQVFDYALSLRLLRRQNQEQGGSSFYRYDAGVITPGFEPLVPRKARSAHNLGGYRVRIRLSAGGKRIRTLSPSPEKSASAAEGG